ncbi:MAG TPA: hypothetical protein VGL81_03200 [Polyangiaceae bacterium]|jgi:hypothetical protein
MKGSRILQVVIASIWALGELALAPIAIKRWDIAGPSVLILPIMLTFLLLPVVTIELQFRTMLRKGQRVRAAIDAIAARAFDRPADVRPGYDLSVTMPASMAGFVSAIDAGAAFTTSGQFRGANVSIASHVSRAGRQFGEMSHVYSHVVVDVPGVSTRFYLARQGGVVKSLARAAGVIRDVKIGDDAFDAMWNVDADEPLAHAVLDDPGIRARLMELKSKVALVSQDFGTAGMSVILTNHGLAVRWPGDFNVELAVYIRDLLLDMRARMLPYAVNQGAFAAQATA